MTITFSSPVSSQTLDHQDYRQPSSSFAAGSVDQNSQAALDSTLQQHEATGDKRGQSSEDDLLRKYQAFGSPHKVSKIACIGAGYVGGPTSAVIAFKNLDLDVTAVDLNPQRIAAWNSTSLPIYEPGLYELVSLARDGYEQIGKTTARSESSMTSGNGSNPSDEDQDEQESISTSRTSYRRPNLFFSTDVQRAIEEADLIFISVNTPTKLHGVGKGSASDLRYVEAAARSIALYATTDKIVVEKSTVPCRTAESIRKVLDANCRPGVRFEILSNPEFLAEGTAVSDMLYPDRILIGFLPTSSGYRAAASLRDIYANWVPYDRIITMNLWSSELSKLAANALLAQRISSVNALSAICEKTGADINEVAYACGLDSRLGSHMLKAGPGFGGSCFKKDLLNLVYISESLHLYEVAAYWKSVVTINEYQKDRFAKRIISCLFNSLTEKKIAILGFAYKKDTSDTRESPAIDLVRHLAAEKANVAIYDPAVKAEQVWFELENDAGTSQDIQENVRVCHSAYDACLGAHAVVILTEWEEFTNKEDNACFLPTTTGPYVTLGWDVMKVSRLDTSSSSSSISSFCDKPGEGRIKNDGTSSGIYYLKPTPNLKQSKKYDSRLDWSRIARGMQKPKFVFDGRNIVDRDELEKLGFKVEAIGRASTDDGMQNFLQNS